MKHKYPINSKHTSIMHDREDNKFVPEINLLYTDYGVSAEPFAPSSSTHNFWQMECVLKGTITACFDGSKLALTEQQLILIPPGVEHNFIYNGQRRTWSFKFNQSPDFIDESQVLILPDKDSGSQKLCELFFQLLAEYQQFPTSLYSTLEYLIGGIMVMNYAKLEDEQNLPKWAIKAKEFIAINIASNINLEDLAEHLSYTRIHLSRLCQAQLKLKLKDFFDQEKAAIVRKKLLYSSRSISQIAKETGFNDVYSFSRFYKRVTGLPPSAQRNLV
ncbi:MAG: AraC family transcriptional regulator [Victivallaceae bacterium]|nr:AraC family transcriptional regulator [Victivallaceae bacterium]